MRNILVVILGICFSAQMVFAQFIEQPATWSHKVIHVEGNVYEMQFTATLQEPWHMYDLGP
ncbi:MAG: hypothetical protein WC961_07670, partial [Anaerovoracaceae bacterium]